jgi:tRNA(Glu) U13 pseudouridine synthase TruD
MEYELNEKTFFVEELFKPQLSNKGKYLYYTVEKKSLSHKQLLRRLPRDACFNGKKDKNASTKQWFSTMNPIEEINEKELKMKYKGRSDEKIWIGKHKGNKFKIIMFLEKEEINKIRKIKWKNELIANYFGKQRFDERINKLKELIEKKEWEEALKYFLCEKSNYDTEKSSEIKKEIQENWNEWDKLIENEVIPEAKKGIFIALKEGKGFENAFEFVEKKSLKTMLKAIQAKRWNDLLHNLVLGSVTNNLEGLKASKNVKRKLIIQANDFEKKFGINKLERETYFVVKQFKGKQFKGKNLKENIQMEFELNKGCYGTIFLEYLEKMLG